MPLCQLDDPRDSRCVRYSASADRPLWNAQAEIMKHLTLALSLEMNALSGPL